MPNSDVVVIMMALGSSDITNHAVILRVGSKSCTEKKKIMHIRFSSCTVGLAKET